MSIIHYLVRAAMYTGLLFIAHVVLHKMLSPLGLACLLGCVLALTDD